jgi:hypothetical protein
VASINVTFPSRRRRAQPQRTLGGREHVFRVFRVLSSRARIDVRFLVRCAVMEIHLASACPVLPGAVAIAGPPAFHKAELIFHVRTDPNARIS